MLSKCPKYCRSSKKSL